MDNLTGWLAATFGMYRVRYWIKFPNGDEREVYKWIAEGHSPAKAGLKWVDEQVTEYFGRRRNTTLPLIQHGYEVIK